MARVQCNLHEVKEIENLPVGTYSVRVTEEPKLVESKQKRTPGIEFNGVYTDPGTEIAPGTPRKFRDTVYKSAELGWQHFRVKEICEAFGVGFDTEGFDTADFVNAECKVAVGQESYTKQNGESAIRNSIEHYLRA